MAYIQGMQGCYAAPHHVPIQAHMAPIQAHVAPIQARPVILQPHAGQRNMYVRYLGYLGKVYFSLLFLIHHISDILYCNLIRCI